MADNENNKRSHISPPVFFGSAFLILVFVIFGAGAPETAGELFGEVQNWVVDTFGWFYLLSVAVFLVFAIGLALSSYGNIKLGLDHDEPEFSYRSWFAMLFSAGMGIGLLYFGVAEPVMHFTNPPIGEGGTVDAARRAMSITFFHWGLHAWAIYAVIGMVLAYYSYRYGLPLTIRSALYPLIGDRIYGPIGHIVDVFAVLGTMFGVATSLGLGVMQVNAGLSYLFDIPNSTFVQIILIGVITLMATGSVVAGLNAGIRRLSEINLFLAVLLMAFVLVTGPTHYLLQTLVQNTGAYLSDIVDKTFNLYAYEPTGWIGGWTLFYWGWWIAWSPFVGMFIARVSRGRTIREFILGVLFVPVGFTFMWMTFFGNTAMSFELGGAAGLISNAVSEDVSLAIFKLFEQLPLSMLASGLATLLVITFFVTSSDSGSLVIDTITSGGHADPPKWQRIFWAVMEGVVASTLLLAGGLAGLQTASIVGALPFTFIMLIVCYGMLQALRMEGLKRIAYGAPPPTLAFGGNVPLHQRLRAIISHPDKRKVSAFMHSRVVQALTEVAEEMRKQNLDATIQQEDERVALSVGHGDESDFVYAVELHGFRLPGFAFPEMESKKEEQFYYRAEVHLIQGSQDYDIMGFTKDQIINDVLAQYDRHMHFLHLAR